MTTDDKLAAEMRLLYQNCLDRIAEQKRQQWTITYYSLLIYVALVGLAQITRDGGQLSIASAIVIGGLAIAAGSASILLIAAAQKNLVRRRRRVHEIRDNYFDPEPNKLFGSGVRVHTSFTYNWPFWSLKMAVTAIGAGLVNWVVWR